MRWKAATYKRDYGVIARAYKGTGDFEDGACEFEGVLAHNNPDRSRKPSVLTVFFNITGGLNRPTQDGFEKCEPLKISYFCGLKPIFRRIGGVPRENSSTIQ
jgi:hypothetical protein